MSWLVTGGAGYIGAHVVRTLLEQGEPVVVLDDLSTGARERVPAEVPLAVGSILDEALVGEVCRQHRVRGVVHIAAKKQVGESVEDPLLYYRENVTGTATLLAAAARSGVSAFVFSSSAAVYGQPPTETVTEDSPTVPTSPYGETKLAGEWLARAVAGTGALRAVALRYFNVAGAAAPELGDPGVFNLIPLVFRALSRGERPQVFGADYPTPDGTGVRDYVDVRDIATAHVAALRALADGAGPAFRVYNIGRGEGVSVLEVLSTVAAVTGSAVDPQVVGRRPGDPARVVADAARIQAELGWRARHDLADMVGSAWAAWPHRG